MNIAISKGKAFVALNANELICIGEAYEVKGAKPPEIAKMVLDAMAIAVYNKITAGKAVKAH